MPKAKRSSAKKPVKLKSPPLPKPDPVSSGPVYAGPDGEGPNGGVTQSLLHKFLICRERTRLLLVEGLKPADSFVAPLEFGSMWHVCEEALASEVAHFGERVGTTVEEDDLRKYVETLNRKYPMQRPEIADWAAKVSALWPLYKRYWADHDDVKNRTPLLAEQAFDVPYRLPSGRTVRLRGKWDGVSALSGIWVDECKTKGTIDRQKITRQIVFDLQTGFYMVALGSYDDADFWQRAREAYPGMGRKPEIKGVRYNVVRRSAHKSVESMLKKYHEDAAVGRSDEWFARWTVEVSAEDVRRFRTRCLDPVLEQFCDWWDWVRQNPDPFRPQPHEGGVLNSVHFQAPFAPHPYGVVEGGTDMDEAVMTGSTVGLRRIQTLFEELV